MRISKKITDKKLSQKAVNKQCVIVNESKDSGIHFKRNKQKCRIKHSKAQTNKQIIKTYKGNHRKAIQE